MSTTKRFWMVLSLTALAHCSSPGGGAGTRVVTGELKTTYAVKSPVVIAESSDHRVFVTHLNSDGSFRLELPTNVSYRLTLATATKGSTYQTVARINWPLQSGAARWAKVGDGTPLSLGGVVKR